ncbi:TorF family putative porin [Roseateles violae]|uniref:TorF family putative porin n=1 Tax=Roseateles violae TaxID=3058042 RepID=A0ABT8DN94_9BURK|nr:TorF family putative porin [Pelomonas sp. PFR6]MDN3919857.1 TorF family putative porin [Pelomonas sp. PFR6]
MAGRIRRAVLIALSLASAVAAAQEKTAAGQWGGSVSLQSDQRYRGISLSDERPQAQASLGYDGVSGWYGGALLGRARFDAYRQSTMLLGYLGRVGPLATDLDAEAGLLLSHFASENAYDYGELYAGLIAPRWRLRLHLSPDYFGRDMRSLYADLELNRPLDAAWQLFAHLGVLQGLGGSAVHAHDTQADLRLGAAWRHGAYELQLSWVGVQRGGPYAAAYEQQRSTAVLGLLISF